MLRVQEEKGWKWERERENAREWNLLVCLSFSMYFSPILEKWISVYV